MHPPCRVQYLAHSTLLNKRIYESVIGFSCSDAATEVWRGQVNDSRSPRQDLHRGPYGSEAEESLLGDGYLVSRTALAFPTPGPLAQRCCFWAPWGLSFQSLLGQLSRQHWSPAASVWVCQGPAVGSCQASPHNRRHHTAPEGSRWGSVPLSVPGSLGLPLLRPTPVNTHFLRLWHPEILRL